MQTHVSVNRTLWHSSFMKDQTKSNNNNLKNAGLSKELSVDQLTLSQEIWTSEILNF